MKGWKNLRLKSVGRLIQSQLNETAEILWTFQAKLKVILGPKKMHLLALHSMHSIIKQKIKHYLHLDMKDHCI